MAQETLEELVFKVKSMFRVCTDDIKVDPKDIEQEKIDDAYNLALSNVLELLITLNTCDHDWYNIPNYDEQKGNWALCQKCKQFKKIEL